MRSPIQVVARKELRDAFRDKRSLFSALVFGPLFGPIVFSSLITATLRIEEDRADDPIEVSIVGAGWAPNLVAFLESHDVAQRPPVGDPDGAVASGAEDLVLVIPAGFGSALARAEPAEVTLVVDRSRRASEAKTARLEAILSAYGHQIGLLRLQVRGVDPTIVRAVSVVERDLSTPKSRGALILAMLPYLMMMGVFVGSMYLAIDSTAGERERRSLEPLLINPVPRWMIIAGKLAATTVLGVISLSLTIATFAVSVRFIPADVLDLELNLTLGTSVLLFLLVLPITLIGASVQMVIGAFTKSFREAQTYTSLLLLVPMVPAVALMLIPVRMEAWMAPIPILSQNLLIERIVRGEPVDPIAFGVASVSSFAFGLLLAAVAARLYDRPNLVFD